MILSDNYIDGGLGDGNTNPDPKAAWADTSGCKCDGQFSESLFCRKMVVETPLVKGKLMHGLPDQSTLCGQQKLVAIYTQDCGHSGTNAEQMTKAFSARLHPIEAYAKRCPDTKVLVMVSPCTAQSKSLDAKYPHQAWGPARLANEHIRKNFPSATIKFMTGATEAAVLDWFALTKLSQKSDGLHSLSNVNIEEADFLLQALYLFSKATADAKAAELDIYHSRITQSSIYDH